MVKLMPTQDLMKKIKWEHVRQRLFNQVHRQHLIYNTCWEDPRCDRALLDINSKSRVITITSAGCNAFDYLLDSPQALYCLDTNPRQNALMELKMAVFREASFQDLDQLFGQGYHPQAHSLYHQSLRDALSPHAQGFWDKRISCFQNKQKGGSFYFSGTAGRFAWYFNQFLRANPGLNKASQKFLQAGSLAEQAEQYYNLEPRLLPGLLQWLLRRQVTLSMLGIPPAQRRLIQKDFPDGIGGYIKDCLRRVFTQTYLPHNYFWLVYMAGRYPDEHRPNYLKPGHFETIRRQLSKIHLHTTSITAFLKTEPEPCTHFILLDHQDWLAEHQPGALTDEWNLIAQKALPGARTLMRSAASEVNFLPSLAYEHFRFQKFRPGEEPFIDRVGTYQSTYLGIKPIKNSTPETYGIC